MTRRTLLALLVTAPWLRAAGWEKQPFPNWTPKMVDQLLTDSPWARPVSVKFEFQPAPAGLAPELIHSLQIGLPPSAPDWPGRRTPRSKPVPTIPTTGGPRYPVRAEVYLTVRWSSALPIRQALALERWGRRGLERPEAVSFLNEQPTDHVLEIFGLPARLGNGGTESVESDLKRTARLSVEGRLPIEAATAEVPEHGQYLSAELRFPRMEAISVSMGNLEFRAHAGPLEIDTKFKLKTMVYGGRLEL